LWQAVRKKRFIIGNASDRSAIEDFEQFSGVAYQKLNIKNQHICRPEDLILPANSGDLFASLVCPNSDFQQARDRHGCQDPLPAIELADLEGIPNPSLGFGTRLPMAKGLHGV
jgi:hypothetical protein